MISPSFPCTQTSRRLQAGGGLGAVRGTFQPSLARPPKRQVGLAGLAALAVDGGAAIFLPRIPRRQHIRSSGHGAASLLDRAGAAYCSSFVTTTWRTLRLEYVDTGRVLVSFRHKPIRTLHPFAFNAAEISECGWRQGFFWQTHDQLFELLHSQPSPLRGPDQAGIVAALRVPGLDKRRLESCLNEDAAEVVRRDLDLADRLQVRSTPTFFLGKVTGSGLLRAVSVIRGARPVDHYRQALEVLFVEGGDVR